MSDEKPTTAPLTDKFTLELETNGPVAPEAGPQMKSLLQPVEAPKPKDRFRPVEFPPEVYEEAHARIRELAALSPQRDQLAAKNPPPPDEKAKRLAELEADITAIAAALDLRVELLPADGKSTTSRSAHGREPIGTALQRFKKLIERSGMKRELRAREYYEKPRE